jgi:(-)-alpha-terpineol synthase
VFELINL